MRIVDLYPLKGTHNPGETVQLFAEVQAEEKARGAIQLRIYQLAREVEVREFPASFSPGSQRVALLWQPPSSPAAYGIEARLLNSAGEPVSTASTACDVLSSWADFPRYGFLTDFSGNRQDISSTIASLARYHINGIQFYDWHYRHDYLVSPTEVFVDPLGRRLSVETIRNFIRVAHEQGMAAMAYLAVYAASLEFWQRHQDWALYNAEGRPLTFEGFLGLMDPSPEGAWSRHLRAQCASALADLPFDGLHIDQYGEPRAGFNVAGQPVNLPQAFKRFIEDLRLAHPSATLTFNAVKNWPIEALATAPQDFVYIEMWASTPHYADLYRIIRQARHLSNSKPVVIALYLDSDNLANIRLSNAIIYASGATRIELGEQERLLADPYFPKHQAILPELARMLRRYADFAVRYSAFIGPAAANAPDVSVQAPEGVWPICRSLDGWLVVHLINMRGLDNQRWHEPHRPPWQLEHVRFDVKIPRAIKEVWWASPDGADLRLVPADHRFQNNTVQVSIPRLDYWSCIAFELDAREA